MIACIALLILAIKKYSVAHTNRKKNESAPAHSGIITNKSTLLSNDIKMAIFYNY